MGGLPQETPAAQPGAPPGPVDSSERPAAAGARLTLVFINHLAPHPFVTPTSLNTRDVLTDAVFELLERVGITGSLAQSMNITAQAVLKRAGGRERLDRVVVAEFSRRWSRWCLSIPPHDAVPVALPRDQVERRHLESILTRRLGRRPDLRELDGLVALAEGVRSLMRGEEPVAGCLVRPTQ